MTQPWWRRTLAVLNTASSSATFGCLHRRIKEVSEKATGHLCSFGLFTTAGSRRNAYKWKWKETWHICATNYRSTLEKKHAQSCAKTCVKDKRKASHFILLGNILNRDIAVTHCVQRWRKHLRTGSCTVLGISQMSLNLKKHLMFNVKAFGVKCS